MKMQVRSWRFTTIINLHLQKSWGLWRSRSLWGLLISSFFLFMGCSSFFYYPSSQEFFSPSQVSLNPEKVVFLSATGEQIHAWFFKSLTFENLGTFVFFHGNAENMSTHFMSLSWLPRCGYNYLIFDYPGYGRVQGNPTPQNTLAAGIAALRWVHANRDHHPLIIYGQSLGGAIALRAVREVSLVPASSRIPIGRIILDSTFISYRRVGQQTLSRFWLTWPLQPLAFVLVSDEYSIDPSDLGPLTSSIPLLVIHNRKDPVVDFENAREIFEKSSGSKQLWILEGSQHGNTFAVDRGKYREKLLTYLRTSPNK